MISTEVRPLHGVNYDLDEMSIAELGAQDFKRLCFSRRRGIPFRHTFT
jgi:hypothetical protein